jgi:hypothetical protein
MLKGQTINQFSYQKFGGSGFKTGARQNRMVWFRKRPFCQIWMQFGRAGFETGATERALKHTTSDDNDKDDLLP